MATGQAGGGPGSHEGAASLVDGPELEAGAWGAPVVPVFADARWDRDQEVAVIDDRGGRSADEIADGCGMACGRGGAVEQQPGAPVDRDLDRGFVGVNPSTWMAHPSQSGRRHPGTRPPMSYLLFVPIHDPSGRRIARQIQWLVLSASQYSRRPSPGTVRVAAWCTVLSSTPGWRHAYGASASIANT